ncbi:DUF6220 domain-containing protein [Saccharothrix variisporea]|uniref:Uncharacterized protein n=1 Tax=Saccharothrix variisporea TaxID=543527 RepID=A0A495X513_9PSEU|nr:DUF6220 domain-containing protein [Saccharothrix variisporea]RKT67713.1 hypothetical protein DFJ66_0889 [Saccharothrix variisporea]
MRRVFAVLTVLLALVVAAEFFFAASGAFGSGALYRPHHALGYVTFLLPLVMAVVAGVAKLPRRLIWLPAVVVALTGVQVVIAKVARTLDDPTGPLVFGLHAVNGMAIAAVVGLVLRQALAGARVRSGQPA